MLPDLNRVIEQVSKEKGIDKAIIIAALEDAMLSAARRTFGLEHQIEAKFNPDIGEVELFEIKTVVDQITDPTNQIAVKDAKATLDPDAEVGDELLSKLSQEKFGRIAAQAAKQNIIQRVREAERGIIFNEFKDRKGELFSGIVQRFERKNIIVNLGRTDAILPEKEQIPRERYRQGDRIRAYILDVELTSKGPQIVLSRTHPGLLTKLFEQEVPEIYEGIVEVKGAAREPGGRAKIAVYSNDSDVDPVGACVGMRGTRVQSVVQELRGEKIDIVPVTAELLYQHGFKSAEELATSDVETVTQVDGVSAEKATTIIAAAQKHVEQKRVEAEARAVADAAAAEVAAAEAVAAAAAEAVAAEAAAAEAAA